MQPARPPARPQSDASLDIDLSSVLAESQAMSKKVTPDSGPWDVIIVGSGAAGGMAAFQLATAGIKVLVLEAGRMLDGQKEYRTMEWPYQSLRRQRMPPDMRQPERRRVQLRRPALRQPSGVREVQEAHELRRQHVHAQLGREREGESDDRDAVRLGTGAHSRRQDELLGAWGTALRPVRVQGRKSRRLRRGLADRLRRREGLLRQGRHAARLLGQQGRARPGA